MKSTLNFVIEARGWNATRDLRGQLQKAVSLTFAQAPTHLRIPCSATVLLTTNAVVRRLNRDFRGIDKPTNVLSFPQYEHGELPKKGKAKGPISIGDIAIAYQYVVAESKREHKMLINHVTHLVIHGLLHLLGYDHMTDKEASRMERLETKIMAALDLPNPYLAVKPMEHKKARVGSRKRRAPAKPKR